MRLLIYGAGVIGCWYAVLFSKVGYDTTIYARGKRLELLISMDREVSDEEIITAVTKAGYQVI